MDVLRYLKGIFMIFKWNFYYHIVHHNHTYLNSGKLLFHEFKIKACHSVTGNPSQLRDSADMYFVKHI